MGPPDATTDPVPAPFCVAVDDREKLPYAFAGLRADARQHGRPLAIPTVRRHLPTGDYTIDGWDGPAGDPGGPAGACGVGRRWADRVAVERKSLSDLFSTVGRHRDRFERELGRLNLLDIAWVVVESEWSVILRPPPTLRSELPPKVVARSVAAWQVRFPRVHWWAVPGRDVAEAVTYRLLERFWREVAAEEPPLQRYARRIDEADPSRNDPNADALRHCQQRPGDGGGPSCP